MFNINNVKIDGRWVMEEEEEDTIHYSSKFSWRTSNMQKLFSNKNKTSR